MSLQNAIDIAEANLRDAKLDWEDFCREKDELEEPVDENDTEVTVQNSVMEALIMAAKAEAARQEGARGGEPVEHASDCQSHIVDVRGRPDECTCGALASPAEPSGWRPIERLKSWQGGMETEGPNAGEFTASMVFANHADCVSFIQFCASFPLPPTSEGGA